MDSSNLSNALYSWLGRQFTGIELGVGDLTREGNKVRLKYQGVTQIFVFDGEEGSKNRPGKPLSLSIYVPEGSAKLEETIRTKLGDMKYGRGQRAQEFKGQEDSRRRKKEIGNARRIAREYDRIFRDPEIGMGGISYDGEDHSGVCVSTPIKRIPRGSEDGLSDKLFSVARRELFSVVHTAVYEEKST